MRSLNLILFTTVFSIMLVSCIGDDFVFDTIDPVLRIKNPVDTIEKGTGYQFDYSFFNNIGVEEDLEVIWSSSDDSVISIDEDGFATALEIGEAIISINPLVESEFELKDEIMVAVGEETVISNPTKGGNIQTTSSYVLEGTFSVEDNDGNLLISFEDDYRASSSLPGLYLYLTNNPTTTNNALEIGKVTVFSGAHTYDVAGVDINEYQYLLYFCKPFNVKVGDGEITN